jgi:hypothetical protein
LTDNTPYFFRAEGLDFSNLTGNSTVLLNYDCAAYFVAGDYNGDNNTNLLDLVYVVDFIISKGPAPIGGAGRADANCDGIINITDIVYLMNYMFGSASTPCY